MLKRVILLYILLNCITCYSQDIQMDKKVKEIIHLGKDSIVQLALDLIAKEASIQNFTKIKVKTNGKEVHVSLQNPIKYLPIKSIYYFDVGVSIFNKKINYNSISNGVFNNKSNIQFYKRTRETDKIIQFIIESINKSNKVDKINIENFDNDMIIREYKNYYDITVISKLQESFYKIEKKSGKIYDPEHNNLIPSPEENDWKEIN